MKKEKDIVSEIKDYSFLAKLFFFFNLFLALSIFFFSHKLIETEFGRASLVFSFIMLTTITLLGILNKWGSK